MFRNTLENSYIVVYNTDITHRRFAMSVATAAPHRKALIRKTFSEYLPMAAGAVLIIALFSVLIFRGFRIALWAPDRYSAVLAAGLVTLIAVQTVLNLCVVTNLLPSTGIALPFFSYGGTALAVNLGEMGIVLAVSRQRNQTKIQEVSL